MLEDILFGRSGWGVSLGLHGGRRCSILAVLEEDVKQHFVDAFRVDRKLCLQRSQELIHLLCSEQQSDEVAQPLEESSVTVFIVKVKGGQTHEGLKVHQLRGLRLEVLAEAVLKLLLEVVGAVRGGHELHFLVDPLHDDVHTLAIELLRAAELEVSQALFESFADVYVFKFLFDEVAGVLDQVEGNL